MLFQKSTKLTQENLLIARRRCIYILLGLCALLFTLAIFVLKVSLFDYGFEVHLPWQVPVGIVVVGVPFLIRLIVLNKELERRK